MDKHQLYFQEVLQQLNTAQRAAVQQTEGPVLVVAGPGTGKTQILGARIGYILQETDALPQNILCMTYTDAGVIAMRERLTSFIGPLAYEVHINTFHSFCNKVIQENMDDFSLRDLQPASDLDLVDVFHQLMDGFDENHPLKDFKEPYRNMAYLKGLFDVLKKENWTSQGLIQQCEEYLESLKTNENYFYKRKSGEFKAGDFKQKDFDKEKKTIDKLISAAKEFDVYLQIMADKGLYDFQDMILWVLHAFQTNESVLLKYQEQYLYFLVDEYQDTNGSQNKILELLSSYWDSPNVFAVGDDDQSIFRFQGANVANIQEFIEKHKQEMEIIVLDENYRSTQHILDASRVVIEHNKERITRQNPQLVKNLTAKGKIASLEIKPVVKEFPNVYYEELGILERIKELKSQGVAMREIAIIYPKHRVAENLIKLFRKEEIPYNIRRKQNALQVKFIKNIITILEYVFAESSEKPNSAEFLLFELMHFSFFNISVRDIAVISRECSSYDEEKRKAWRNIISLKEVMFRLGLESASQISKLESCLVSWIESAKNDTLQVLFEKIITQSGILAYLMVHPERTFLMQCLTSLFDFIKAESVKKPDLSIKELYELIYKMEKNAVEMPVYQFVKNVDGINFITAHSSKGLEFEYVFVMGSTANNWEKKRAIAGGFSMPKGMKDDVKDLEIEENRRLFFVAMTRAKKELTISYSLENEAGKETEKSRFVVEMLDSDVVEFQNNIVLPEEKLVQYQFDLMSYQNLGTIPLIDKNVIDEALKSFKLSVTSLNKYLRCPLSFYFETIVRVPQARKAAPGFGSAVHYALEMYFKEMLKSPSHQFPTDAFLIEMYKKGLNQYQSHFTRAEFQNYVEYGMKILPEYVSANKLKWNKVSLVEFDMRNVQYDGIPLSGKLDKLEFTGKEVNVVDYKTGNPDYAKSKLSPPNEKNPLGEDYWRQLVFYKILMDAQKNKDWEMVSSEMEFVEPSKKTGEFVRQKLVISPTDVATVKDQIKLVWTKIHNHEFQDGCGDANCTWCNFVKSNYGTEVELTEDE